MTPNEQTLLEFIRAARQIVIYRAHEDSCEIRCTDFCTCGMKSAYDYFQRTGNAVVDLLNRGVYHHE